MFKIMTFLKAIYIDNEPESFYTVCISFPIFKNKESLTYSPRLVTPTANKWPLYKVWTFQYAMVRVWIFLKKNQIKTQERLIRVILIFIFMHESCWDIFSTIKPDMICQYICKLMLISITLSLIPHQLLLTPTQLKHLLKSTLIIKFYICTFNSTQFHWTIININA